MEILLIKKVHKTKNNFKKILILNYDDYKKLWFYRNYKNYLIRNSYLHKQIALFLTKIKTNRNAYLNKKDQIYLKS